VTHDSHEFNKLFCDTCKQNRYVGYLCYMPPLKDVLPSAGDKVLYVFYDFETIQTTRYSDKAALHIPALVCLQQFCSQCEYAENCVRCGKRKHLFWTDPEGDMLSYLCEPHPWANKIVAIAHNAKAFDLHFIPNTAILLK